jgi:cytochrome b
MMEAYTTIDARQRGRHASVPLIWIKAAPALRQHYPSGRQPVAAAYDGYEDKMDIALEETKHTVMVWDPAVRIAHWVLVAGFAIAYLTSENEPGGLAGFVHVWAGYAIGVTVVLRILWGIIGPRHARFTDFLYRPRTIARYLAGLFTGKAHRYIGHSPAGGAMTVVLLLCLAATVMTGFAALGEQGLNALGQAYANGLSGPEGTDAILGELHGVLANVTLGLVILHIVGVAVASLVHRENLVRAMIDGNKRAHRSR